MHTYSFEKLGAWQDAKKLVVFIYNLTEEFPGNEKFGLVSQIKRAAVSVPSNIAEGTCRNTSRDQAHFYGVAYSSLIELLNHLLISYELKWITDSDLSKVRVDIEQLSFKISALRKSVLVKLPS
jgi:four helix bundle protein